MTSSTEELRRLAADTFGWQRLRDEQLRAMREVMAGHDVLAVLPTGAGKSAIYQVPALSLDGTTVVVSPLIALRYDQIDAIEDGGAPRVVTLNSTQRAVDRRRAWQVVREGAAEYLFLSPEQLARQDVLDALARLGVSLFVVDEAHCVSERGHDFRPDYLRLASVIERLGHPGVIALTATAAPPVRRDIVTRLGLRDHREVVAGFDRPNLHLAVDRFTDDADKRAAAVGRILDFARGSATGCGLVCTASRRDTESYAGELAAAGLTVAVYHAGLRTADRERVHEAFLAGDLDVVVATSAFGMGIDKPDVRFVVHTSVQDSLDAYYQQIGRAGRDGEPADVVLCYRPEDLALQRFLTAGGIPLDVLGEVARALRERGAPVRPASLKDDVHASATRRTRAVNLLQQTGAVTGTGNGRVVYVDPGLAPDDAARQAAAAAEARRRLVRSRLEMLRGYAETTGCRRQYLLGYFGEQRDCPCGNCDTCDAGTAHRHSAGPDEFPRDSPVRHPAWGHGTVMSVERDRLTVLFEDGGYRTLSLPDVREHDLLTIDATPDEH